jgi:hypothetical protein
VDCWLCPYRILFQYCRHRSLTNQDHLSRLLSAFVSRVLCRSSSPLLLSSQCWFWPLPPPPSVFSLTAILWPSFDDRRWVIVWTFPFHLISIFSPLAPSMLILIRHFFRVSKPLFFSHIESILLRARNESFHIIKNCMNKPLCSVVKQFHRAD